MAVGFRKPFAFTKGRWLVLVFLLAGCRERLIQVPIDWQAPMPENAALLLLDHQGTATRVCLPGQAGPRPIFAGLAVRHILDIAWNGGPWLAGLALTPDDAGANELVLASPSGQTRKLGQGVVSARFSPDGTALAFHIRKTSPALDTSYVLDLAADQLSELPASVDPRWEADGQHLRATLLRADPLGGPPRSLRVRWDRQSQHTTLLGPGSAQIPAPRGAAVAWSADQRSPNAPTSCVVRMGSAGAVQVPHKVQGDFCLGIADDRSVRWSSDGQYLAFPHPGPVPGGNDPSKSFVDVVIPAGGRLSVLMSLHRQVGPAVSDIAVAPESVWFDWSPSQRFLAIQDGLGDLRVYDFEAQGIAGLGKGGQPQWSPGGAYLLIMSSDSTSHAWVLPGISATTRIDLGPAREARWLPAQACDG